MTFEDLLKTESPEMQLHGIKLEGFVTELEVVSQICYLFNEQGSGNRKMRKMLFEGRTVTLLYSENSKIEIFLKSSKYPLTFMEFEKFISFLDGTFNGLLPLLKLQVISLEIGRDFRKWELNGIKSIKLTAFRNAWLQIYQHTKETMRVEIRINDRVSLGDAIHILRANTNLPITEFKPLTDTGEGYR